MRRRERRRAFWWWWWWLYGEVGVVAVGVVTIAVCRGDWRYNGIK